MALSSYRIKRWLRNRKDWRDYTVYLGTAQRRGDRPPPTIPVLLDISPGNALYPEGVTERPEWFVVGEDFFITFGSRTIDFDWDTDHWIAVGEFPTETGYAVLTQGDNSHVARWINATKTINHITAEGDVYITAANGVFITWSGD